MVIFEIKYNGKIGTAIIFDIWDIENKKHSIVSKIGNVTKDDIGKYLKLNDGSKQFVKILNFWKGRVETSSGLYYTNELICCVNPRLPKMEYCGAKRGEESFAVVPIRDEESSIVKEILATGRTDEKRTKRINSVTTEEIKSYIISKGKNEQSVIDEVINLAFYKNQHQWNALKAIGGVLDVNVFSDKPIQQQQLSLAAQFGFGTIKKELGLYEEAKVIEQ